jgi:hypothetical protein
MLYVLAETRVNNLVFIKGTESSLGAHPADYLIQHVGGQALVDGTIGSDDDSARVVLSLACYAPDEASAETIEVETNAYLRSPQDHFDPSLETTWMSYTGPMGFTVLHGKMRRARRALVFTGEFFHIADDFPALLAYLRARGCTDFRYELVEKREPED